MKGVEVKMSNSKNSKEQLIERLYAVMNAETEKPCEEMDTDLIDDCVDLILELQGKNFTLSNEEIEEMVRSIPFVDNKNIVDIADTNKSTKPKRKKNIAKKLLLIAATISVLFSMMIVSSSGNAYENITITLENILDAPVGIPIRYGNVEFINYGKAMIFKSREEFFVKEDYDVLIPSTLPEGINIKDISVTIYNDEINVCFDNIITSYNICPNKSVPEGIISGFREIHTDKGTPCYYGYHYNDIIQINFEYGGDLYTICGTDMQILLDVINSMEV